MPSSLRLATVIFLFSFLFREPAPVICCAQDATLQSQEQFQEFAKSSESLTQTLLEDFSKVIKWELKNENHNAKERKVLQAELALIEKQLEDMPSQTTLTYLVITRQDKDFLNDKELLAQHQKGEITKDELVEEYKSRWETVEAKRRGPKNLAQQRTIVRQSLKRIQEELGSPNKSQTAFATFLAYRHGLIYLINEPLISELVGVGKDDTVKFSSVCLSNANKLERELALLKRKAVKKTLDELTNDQFDKFSRRLGLRKESIPELYDLMECSALGNVLEAAQAKIGHSSTEFLSDELAKELEEWEAFDGDVPPYWNPKLRKLDMRFHSSEIQQPRMRPWLFMKKLYEYGPSGPTYIPVLNSTTCDLQEIKLLENAAKNSGVTDIVYEQWTKNQIINDRYQQQLRKATNIEEYVSANNHWLQEVGSVLLPQQSVALYQRYVGESGIVIFLTRPDVCDDFGISTSQRNKILAIGKEQGNKLIVDSQKLKRSRILESFQSTPQKTKSKLEELFGTKLEKLAEEFSTTQSDAEIRTFLSREYKKSPYIDKKLRQYIFPG